MIDLAFGLDSRFKKIRMFQNQPLYVCFSPFILTVVCKGGTSTGKRVACYQRTGFGPSLTSVLQSPEPPVKTQGRNPALPADRREAEGGLSYGLGYWGKLGLLLHAS